MTVFRRHGNIIGLAEEDSQKQEKPKYRQKQRRIFGPKILKRGGSVIARIGIKKGYVMWRSYNNRSK